ncbi:hypothetical protein [Halomonas getboli]|uniref:hypothetical protein n=1 Tax=Halomonas getboli TaxID=2935862 RepID=UPI001FFEA0EC|nr:hypothetical protein [Halomonas getboli]MCK2183524.1 hypothetical protein [Halomonas getboli]
MSTRIAVEESIRTAPVGVGWLTFVKADPGTQVGVVAGVLTCIYLLGQVWWIWRRARIEDEKLEMLKREHQAAMAGRDSEDGEP